MPVDVCALVLDACDLLERGERSATDPVVASEAACLREELCAAIAVCDDEIVAADGRGAVATLDRFLARREQPGHRLALSA